MSDEIVKPVFFKIEVPVEHREKFWTRPEGKLEFWAFKDRPRAFLEEKIIFTFDGKPVAEAVVLKIEAPGSTECSATGQYKDRHKVFWNPQHFKKLGAGNWIGPVYHGAIGAFGKLKGQPEAAGMTYFTDESEYADYFASQFGQYKENSTVYPAYIKFSKPFDARGWSDEKITAEKYAELIGCTKDDLYKELFALPSETWFWRFLLMLPHISKKSLMARGYDGIMLLEALDKGQTPSTTSFVVFKDSQIKPLFDEKQPKKFLNLKGSEEGQPDVLYHLSRRTNRSSIKAKGLVPQTKEYKDIPREPGVFFFQTLEQAKDYGYFHAQFINQATDVWECHIPEEYKIARDPHPEMDFADAWCSNQTLAPENLKFVGTILVPTSKSRAPLKSTKVGSEQIPLYHGTTWEAADLIKKQGIKATSWEFKPGSKFVWATTDYGQAESYGITASEDASDKYAVVTFVWDWDKTEPDPEHVNLGEAEEVYRRIPSDIPASAVHLIEYYDQEYGPVVKTATIKTEPMDAEWRERLDEVLAEEFQKRPDLLALRNKLLGFGGGEALVKSMDNPPAEVNRLMERGQFWKGRGQNFKKMQHNNCHGNSVCLMEEGLGSVVNGFALSKDGLWRQHSWVVTPDGGLIETTVRRAAYFGAVLNLEEVKAEYNRMASKTADHVSDEGFWAGEGNAASGVLPICPAKGTVCLAMRSSEVMSPNCWGTIGGAIQEGMSPSESAKAEMAEETGYHGGVSLTPAYVFSSGGGFKYHNFIGVVGTEFTFNPSEEHSWETDYIQWIPYQEVVADMQKNPSHYHTGLLKLFASSKDTIERLLKIKKTGAGKTLAEYLKMVRPNIARHAQVIYDEWNQNEEGSDEEYGAGGICDAISEEIIDLVISAQPFPLTAEEGGQDGDDHSWVVVYTDTEVYGVDIPHQMYERGGGYSWKKVPGVTFEASDVNIFKLDIDPATLKTGAEKQASTYGVDPEVDAISKKYEQKGVSNYVSGSKVSPDYITLHEIVVPKEGRGEGLGSAFMEELAAYADRAGKTIVLTPDTSKGGSSVGRLREFYGRFGFHRNTGRNKDFRTTEAMLRRPKTAAGKDTLQAFMSDLWAQTQANPFNGRERVYQNKAIIEASPFDGQIHVSFIRSVEQGKGYGSEGLDLLIKLADKHGVEINLEADPPHGVEVLSQAQLIKWYKRHGFKQIPNEAPNSLVYKPMKALKLKGPMKTIPMTAAASAPAKTIDKLLKMHDAIKELPGRLRVRDTHVAESVAEIQQGKLVALADAIEKGLPSASKGHLRQARQALTDAETAYHDYKNSRELESETEIEHALNYQETALIILHQILREYERGKTAALQFREETRGAHHGQSDMTLMAEVDGKSVGYVEYSVYDGEPNVQFIKVIDQRKGYGRTLLKKLQSMFPETEVNLGMTTPDGSALLDAMQFEEKPTEYAEKFKELEKLIPEREKLEALAEQFYATEEHTPEEKQTFMTEMDKLNPIHDRIWELENELRGKSPSKRLITAEQQHLFPDSQDAKFTAWFNGSKVVDAEGHPLAVYHGTRSSADFDTFSVDGVVTDDSGDTMSSGSGADPTSMMGAHFAVESNVANQFAEGKGWTSTRYEGEEPKPRVMKVYLRVLNPKDFGSEYNLREFINQGKVSNDALDILCRVETGFEPWEEVDEAAQTELDTFFQKYENDQAFRTAQNSSLLESYRPLEGEDDLIRDAAYELASQARGKLETAGHDGIHYKNVVEGGTAWIAFDPRQIKSAWATSYNQLDPRFTASKQASGWTGTVYHGTKQDFASFDINKAGMTDPGLVGKAVYFSDDPGQAMIFARSPNYGGGKGAPRVLAAKVNLNRPYYVEDGKLEDGRGLNEIHPNGIAKATGQKFQNWLKKKGYDGVVFRLFGEVSQVAVFDTSDIVITDSNVKVANKTAGFAFKSFKKLWHIGTLNPTEKQMGSMEGSGLSVSVNPNEWQYIARLSGDVWEFTKPGNKFLNFHRISKVQRQGIVAWGMKNGYVEPVRIFTAEWYDDEIEETRYSEYIDEAEAKEEAESNGGKVTVNEEGLNPTPKLLQRAHASRSEPTMAWDYLVTVYVEDELDCDGVWWQDNLDQYALSAPRGVIFAGKLQSWAKKKVKMPAEQEHFSSVASTEPQYYMEEGCGMFAVALALLHPKSDIKVISDNEGEKWSESVPFELSHVYCSAPDANYDVKGSRSVEQMASELGMTNYKVLGSWDPKEFMKKFMGMGDKPLYGEKADVEEAKQIILANPEKYGLPKTAAAPKASVTQLDALKHMAGGKPLSRYPGGFWSTEPVSNKDAWGIPKDENGQTIWYVPAQTMSAMEKRGWIARANKYPEHWKDDRVITDAGMLLLMPSQQTTRTASSILSDRGWITPDGKNIPVTTSHGEVARALGFKGKRHKIKNQQGSEVMFALEAGYVRYNTESAGASVTTHKKVAIFEFYSHDDVQRRLGALLRNLPVDTQEVEVEWHMPAHGYETYSLAEGEEKFPNDTLRWGGKHSSQTEDDLFEIPVKQ